MTPLAEIARGPTVGADRFHHGQPPKMISAASAVRAVDGPATTGAEALVFHLERTEIFRAYQRAFETATGLPLALQSVGSFQPPLHGSKQLNPFCALMARGNESCSACLRMQAQVEIAAVRKTATLECFAGLRESAVPVRVGEELVGYLRTGQVFRGRPSPKRFKAVMNGLARGRADAEILALGVAYFKVRVVPERAYESILRLLEIFALHLAAVSNQIRVSEACGEPPAMTKARAFIAEHQHENLRLAEVAEAVHVTRWYFCKLFKRTTGLTLTNYLARVRIESVKQMLLNRHFRVSEAAYASGFQSLSQFNRTFRRVSGESPSAYRTGLAGRSGTRPRAHARAAHGQGTPDWQERRRPAARRPSDLALATGGR